MFDFDWVDDFDLFDIGLAGAMSDELADERERLRQQMEDDLEQDNEDNF